MGLFAKNLRYYMDKKGITGEELAQKIGVATSTVIHWANGRRFPKNEEYIKKIADALGVAEQDLFAPEKKEKIAIEEFMKNPTKYQQYIEDKYDKLPPAIKEIVENLLYLGPEEIDLYYAEIKAKALRKKEIEKDVQIGKN